MRLCYRKRTMTWRTCILSSLGLVLLSGCRGEEPAAPPAQAPSPAASVLSAAEPPLDREALLLAVVRAASAAAVGGQVQDDADQRRLDGKLFALRLRFGCNAAGQSGQGDRSVRLDERKRTVEISAPADLSLAGLERAGLALKGFEAAEGFWIKQPWLLQPACSASVNTPVATSTLESESGSPAAPDAATIPQPEPRVGIARFYTGTDARTHRRARRAYQYTEALSDGQSPSSSGYDLIVTGRLQALPNGKVIVCTPQPQGAPACIISARIELVSIARADSGAVLAEWPSG